MNTTPTFRICRKEVYAVATFGSPLPTHFERFVADANGDYIEKDYGTAQSYRHVSDCNPCAVAKLRATAEQAARNAATAARLAAEWQAMYRRATAGEG